MDTGLSTGVRPSFTFMYFIQMAKDIKLLSWPGRSTILVFVPTHRYSITRNTFSNGTKYMGVQKPFIFETVRDWPMVAMEC